MSERVLLKSMYLNGLQCPKLLWNAHNGKELFPPTDERTQALFDFLDACGSRDRSMSAGSALRKRHGRAATSTSPD